MEVRKLGLLASFAAILAFGPSLVRMAVAEGRLETQPRPTFQDEGRDPVPFNISCSSNAWTVLATSDTIRRSITAQLSSDSPNKVCIATVTASTNACDDTTPGVELSSSAFSWTDYTQSAWRCRSRSGDAVGAVGRIRGYFSRDRGDYGIISQ